MDVSVSAVADIPAGISAVVIRLLPNALVMVLLVFSGDYGGSNISDGILNTSTDYLPET